MRAIIIKHDKRLVETDLPNLAAMQAVVGGLIEPVALKDGSTIWVNEEYLYQFGADDVNWIATDTAGLGGRPEFMLRQPILGDVFITGGCDAAGNTLDVTEQARTWVKRVAREAGGVWE